MKKVFYEIWNVILLILLFLLFVLFIIFYSICYIINWIFIKIFKKEKDLIPIDKWIEKLFPEEDEDIYN